MTMTPNRRMGPAVSETRAALVAAADTIIHQEGLGRLTAGRLAEAIGLKRQIVHYYFPSMEDVVIAVIERNGGKYLAEIAQSSEGRAPLAAFLDAQGQPVGSVASFELIAFALRRERVCEKIGYFVDIFLKLQVEGLERHFAAMGLVPKISPAGAATMFAAFAQSIATHHAFGVTAYRSDEVALLRCMVESYLTRGDFNSCERAEGD